MLNYHPEFEGVIAKESFDRYQQIKNNNEYLDFLDIFYEVRLPSEKKGWVPPTKENMYRKDDSSIQLPDFKKIDVIYDEYGVSLLTFYLAYLV